MSKRSDIIDGSVVKPFTKYGLIYTCKCGWVDVGHAWPESSRPNQGAKNLWSSLSSETGPRSKNGLWFKVTFEMLMGKFGIKEGVIRDFAVRLGLSRADKESVALAIFMSVSLEFEKFQGGPAFAWFSNSSFSAEDLVSNLISFYRVVRPELDYFKMCNPVSREAAERIWDAYGEPGRSAHKVREFRPLFFPCSECVGGTKARRMGPLPEFLNSIRPAELGNNYRPWNEEDPELTQAPPAASQPSANSQNFLPDVPVTSPGLILSKVSLDCYGTYHLWPLIWDENRALIGSNPNRVPVGITLKIRKKEMYTAAQIEDAKLRSPKWAEYR